MSSPACQCGNPQACTCSLRTPLRNSNNNNYYYQPYPSPHVQGQWPPFAFPPAQMLPNFGPNPPFAAPSGATPNLSFQNSFPASFDIATPANTPPQLGQPLGNITNTAAAAAAATAAPQPRRRKRKAPANTSGPSRSRRRVDPGPALNAPSIFGVGPSSASADAAAAAYESVFHPASVNIPGVDFDSILDKPAASTHLATDVWFFVRGEHSDVAPTSPPENVDWSTRQPDKKEFSHISCRFCKIDKWKVWKNGDGQTSVIRDHLKAAHFKVWREIVFHKHLKGWEKFGAESVSAPGEREEFSLPGFYERLVRWIAVDDQSIDVVDCPELRDLLLFVGADLDDHDIPHRTKMAELITARFQIEYDKMIKEIMSAVGRVSFTTDIWSQHSLASHMAVTAHYLVRDDAGHLVLKTRLVAFRHIQGSHTGVNIGKIFVQVVKEIGCLHKMGMVTCDNASNNNTAMDQIGDEFNAIGIPFDDEGNRIRCFPHVVNIAVKAGLSEITEFPTYAPDVVLDHNGDIIAESLYENLAYWTAINSDPVASARTLVTQCRASGQRRENFEKTIIEGNEAGGFAAAGKPARQLRVVSLLKDVETRWSATFLMIDRLIEQYLAVDKFLADPKQSDIRYYALSKEAFEVLSDIRRILLIPHTIQEIVSGEQTPTLSFVLPMYEQLIVMLKNLAVELDKLSFSIKAIVDKLDEYLNMSRRTKIYATAMILNPAIKLKWIRENWSAVDADNARKAIRGSMLEYRREARTRESSLAAVQIPTGVGRRAVSAPSSSHGARALSSGFARFNALSKSLSNPDIDAPSPSPPAEAQTAEDRAEAERRAVLEDERLVDEELSAYEAEGLLDENNPEIENFDLVAYWERRQFKFKYLFCVALDVLPVQASAVPCERVFSSSKETDTLRRNNLFPRMFEMLQILKFIYRQDRLTFTDGLVATEAELSVLDVDPQIIDTLLAQGRTDELEELVNSSYTSSQ